MASVSKEPPHDERSSSLKRVSPSAVQAKARHEPVPPGEADERPGDTSSSVERLRRRLAGPVTAYGVVTETLAESSHSSYGNKMGPAVNLGEPPATAEARTMADWIEDVRSVFRPQDAGRLDGRKLVLGLALLDSELRRRLDEQGFLTALESEIGIDGQLSGRGRALYKPDAVPTLSDQPAKLDWLGREAFAEALAGRLRDEVRRTRSETSDSDSFMLHLEGPWGSGKTSLLKFLERKLKKPPAWLVVDFNAWQNQRVEVPWWLLISAVLREAVGDEHTHRGLRLRLLLRALWWRVQLARAQIASFLLAGAIVGVLAWTGKLTGDDPIGIVTGAISAVVAAVSGLHALLSSMTGGSKQGADTFIKQTSDPMQALKRRFNRLVKDIDRPIAIFIDDLDRCRAEHVVDLLEGVQTIFRDAPIAFVVAADRHWLYDAYAQVYGDSANPGVDPARPLGHLFLEKTFQLSTSVPRISPDDQRLYWKRLLSPVEDGEDLDLKEFTLNADHDFEALETEDAIIGELDRNPGQSPEENRVRRGAAVRRLASPKLQRHIEHTLTPLAPLLEPNPRAMKRFVNAYGVERAVQILEGHATELEHSHERLALWTILRSRWPLLADYLSDDKDAVDDLKKNRAPETVAEDGERTYLRRLFDNPDAARVARGDGLDGIELDSASLSFLIEGPANEP